MRTSRQHACVARVLGYCFHFGSTATVRNGYCSNCTLVFAITLASAWSTVTPLVTLLGRNSFLRLSGTIKKQFSAAGKALSNRAATLAMANRPMGLLCGSHFYQLHKQQDGYADLARAGGEP